MCSLLAKPEILCLLCDVNLRFATDTRSDDFEARVVPYTLPHRFHVASAVQSLPRSLSGVWSIGVPSFFLRGNHQESSHLPMLHSHDDELCSPHCCGARTAEPERRCCTPPSVERKIEGSSRCFIGAKESRTGLSGGKHLYLYH